jgi:hypothetical protein
MIGWIVLGVVVLVLVAAVGLYNNLVRLRALVKEAFSGITVQLRRRADLIPNLVETVQGYATHEREVFEEVSRARSASLGAGSVEATAQADALPAPRWRHRPCRLSTRRGNARRAADPGLGIFVRQWRTGKDRRPGPAYPRWHAQLRAALSHHSPDRTVQGL